MKYKTIMPKIDKINFEIPELQSMKKYPSDLYYIGNKKLLNNKKISIVGTRRPYNYTKEAVFNLSKELSLRGITIVSGCAMGVDAIAHQGAGAENTIAVMGNSLDIKYPSVNKTLIEEIENKGLILSQYKKNFKATRWSFVVRNEIVVALGEILIVAQADLKSGSMRSVEYALKMGKEIFVLPHRLNESKGTNQLLKEGLAKPILDINEFANRFKNIATKKIDDPFLAYCASNPSYEEAIKLYKEKIFEAELQGKIEIHNGKVKVL